MEEKCKEKLVPVGGRSVSFHPCFFPAKKDGYCGVHHPDAAKKREAKSDARTEAKSKIFHKRIESENFNCRAGKRCRELGIQPEEICAPTPN